MEPLFRKVVTVVVSYNAYESGFFPRCLEHLHKVRTQDSKYAIDHSLIIVDSNSGDGTAQKVFDQFTSVDVIASDRNLGYAGGNNVGIDKALEQGADYIAVVTQDVYVEPDWLLEAVAAIESDDKIGVVQPLLLLWGDKEKINSTGNAIHFLGYGYANNYQLPVTNYTNKEITDIPYFSGAVCLLSAKAIRQVSKFDNEMWMYNEDQDLGWRMWLQGYRVVLAPYSIAYHQYEFSRSISKMFYMDRNRLLVVMQNYRLPTLLLLWPVFILNEWATLVLAIKGGWRQQKLAVWRYFLYRETWTKIREKRKDRQKNRKVKDREIVKRFTGKILFQDVMNPAIKYVANPVLGTYWWVVRKVIFW